MACSVWGDFPQRRNRARAWTDARMPRLRPGFPCAACESSGGGLQAQHKDTGQSFAVKIIERANAAFDIEALKKEIETMQRINHPNCIRLHDVFEEVGLSPVTSRSPSRDTWMCSVQTAVAPRAFMLACMCVCVCVCVLECRSAQG